MSPAQQATQILKETLEARKRLFTQASATQRKQAMTNLKLIKIYKPAQTIRVGDLCPYQGELYPVAKVNSQDKRFAVVTIEVGP